MKISPSGTTNLTFSARQRQLAEKIAEKEENYKRFVEHLNANTETPEQRAQRLALQKKEAQKKRDKERRMLELSSRIAYLNSRIMSNPGDDAARGEIAMAKCQRYWVSHND